MKRAKDLPQLIGRLRQARKRDSRAGVVAIVIEPGKDGALHVLGLTDAQVSGLFDALAARVRPAPGR